MAHVHDKHSLSTFSCIPASPPNLSPETVSPDEPQSASKRGRRPTFTPEDDLIIVREVSATKAHIAPFLEVLKRFATAAERAHNNTKLTTKVTSKRLKDRYKKMMDAFALRDASERMMLGIGGTVGEMVNLLGAMLDAQKDIKAAK